MNLYKGNTFNSELTIIDEVTNQAYVFQVGDLIRLGIKVSLNDNDYIIYKEFKVTEECTSINLNLTHEETDIIPMDIPAIFEIELVYNKGQCIKTVYQEEIWLKGVVINE